MNNDTHTKTKRKRHRKPGDIASLRRVLWSAIRQVESIVEGDDPDTKLKAVSALSTAAGVYLKCTEASDLENRLKALEAAAAVSQDMTYSRAA
jgi:hypothetical protein